MPVQEKRKTQNTELPHLVVSESSRNMLSLCALCVLLSLVPGLNTGGGDHTEMYVRPGSDVLLPLSYNLTIDKTNKWCDTFDWQFEQSKISKSRSCDILDYNNITHFNMLNTSVAPFSNYKSSADGTINLINVTWKNSGKYNVIVNNPTKGSAVFTHTYTLHVQAPVLEPFLNVYCRHDGGADIICGTDTGEDLSFSIMVNKGLLLENATSSTMVGNVSEVHTAAASPGPWDITCSVRNRVSDSETRRTIVICPVQLSDPVLEASCLHNGSLNISCSVENGTDTIFFLSLNGTLFSSNVKKGMKRINHVTVPSPDPWDVHCYVNNSLGEKNAKKTNITCPGIWNEKSISWARLLVFHSLDVEGFLIKRMEKKKASDVKEESAHTVQTLHNYWWKCRMYQL
ncbi:uncharacterized protein [Eleutherodactylus coqui]|uniref:uncharacterized protein n=1 Tax=Eleutherodactylus coqui TaxID=57060 RepID=UPI0034631A3B